MHLPHWGISELPFHQGIDPRRFHRSPTHEEALARLHFLVEGRSRLGLLLGSAGTGKSLTLAVLARELRAVRCDVALLNVLGAESDECLWRLAAELGLNPDAELDAFCLWREVTDRIIANRYQQVPTVLLLDDVDRAQPGLQSLVLRLAHADLSPDARLTIVLTCRPERIGLIERPLLELSELRVDLEPWEETETQRYLAAALQGAGVRQSIFSPAAVDKLYELSQGVPRQVAHLAELALLAGAAAELPTIDAGTVENVFYELGTIEVPDP